MSTNKVIPHCKPTLGVEEQIAVANVIASGQISAGPMVIEFEDTFADMFGKRFAFATSSGFTALCLSLAAMEVRAGDEVIIPSFVCDALLYTVLYCDATPVIVDVDLFTGNILPGAIQEAVTEATRLVIVPHMFGAPAEMEEIQNLGINVLEDCALATGAKYSEQLVGTFGVVSVFSFYTTKMLCTGEGGMILTDDEMIAESVFDLRDYLGKTDFRSGRVNFKMTDIAAAMGIEQLKKLDTFIRDRRIIAQKYRDRLRQESIVMYPVYKEGYVFSRYVIKVPAERRDETRSALWKRGIQCGLGVLHPLHKIFVSQNCPVAQQWSERSLSLPIYPTLTDDEIDRVVGALHDCCNTSA